MGQPMNNHMSAVDCKDHGTTAFGDPERVTTVFVNGFSVVGVGAKFTCGGCPGVITVGAGSVRVGGRFAVRDGSETTHGLTVLGSSNVRIGGPSGAGDLGQGMTTCKAMVAGRNPPSGAVYPPGHWKAGQQIPSYTKGQSYNNCGFETIRQIILAAKGKAPTQEQLLGHALNAGLTGKPGDEIGYSAGPSTVKAQVATLQFYGVPAESQTGTALVSSVKDGKGVLAWVWGADIWGPPHRPGTGSHAILVTGVSYDDKGQIVAVWINDTGAGTCSQRVPASVWNNAFRNQIVVTKDPVWR